MNNFDKLTTIDKDLVENIKSIILTTRKNISKRINQELVLTYWRIGKEIFDTEKKNNFDNQTSRQIILNLSIIANWVGVHLRLVVVRRFWTM